ncbi:sensor histidine kinase [Mucilaginibacter flavidus]|uniref:sensor histidine kinase n=1 Tax=Mucilaginibacter flavidus TaxID=2949309 RepID=UPI00209282A5|nr:histidine kinase [Mucilaginibacter flavidus]MCO5947998.1 histidine kinase [Mucilaginibacter flavidus]
MLNTVFRKHATLLGHIIGWLLLWFAVLYYHPITWGISLPLRFWLKQLILLGIMMAVFYLNIYALIPKLLFKKQRVLYVIAVVIMVFISTWLNKSANRAFNIYQLMANRPERPARKNGMITETFIPAVNMLLIGLGTTISFNKKWQREVSLREQLEKEKFQAELLLLKAQINPHFFFNTLNNIYSYTLSDGDVARTAITNLSKMMRYVLYDAESGVTSLVKEIAFIEDYIELMRLRISSKTKVTYLVPASLREQIMIAPMLFLPFVENAFKHGTSNISEGAIIIEVAQQDNVVTLVVTNTVYNQMRSNEQINTGIGISNTARRLELLYPGKYKLETGMLDKTLYQAKLILTL